MDWNDGVMPLHRVLANVDSVVNCAGITRPQADQLASRREVFFSNVALPTMLSAAGEATGTPVVHLSTWNAWDSRLASLPQLSLDDVGQAATGASAERFLDDCEALPENSAYLASKVLLERMVRRTTRSVAVRVTNVYGPEMTAPRLVPRLIQNRLRGGTLRLPDESRNYAHEQELARFLVACATRTAELRDSVVDGTGEANTTIQELVRLVERALPTCYGRVFIDGAAVPPSLKSSLSRYFPDISTPAVALDEGVRLTARAWRRKPSAVASDVVGGVGPASASSVELPGGSIAVKRLVVGHGGSTFVEKASASGGYEGAAGPKIQAEVDFYNWLMEYAPAELRELYVEPDLHPPEAGHACLRTVYRSSGLTVADALVSQGESYPSDAMRDVVRRLYDHSYLRHLRVLDASERLDQLAVLYLDRAYDRLTSFLDFAGGEQAAPSQVRDLAQAIVARRDLVIDGRPASNPLAALERLASAPVAIRLRHAPQHEGMCGHGDLTILNMLWEPGDEAVRLMDPRGLVGVLDPIYDLGKLLFSLSGFALLMRNGLSWVPESVVEHRVMPRDVAVFTRCSDEHVRAATWLGDDEVFAPLHIDSGLFHTQLGLAEAAHYLSDVPYRYAQGRDWDAAMCAMLLGTKRLSQVLGSP